MYTHGFEKVVTFVTHRIYSEGAPSFFSEIVGSLRNYCINIFSISEKIERQASNNLLLMYWNQFSNHFKIVEIK